MEINQITFKGELELWKSKWVSSIIVNYFLIVKLTSYLNHNFISVGENPPKDVFQSIEQCHALIFPLIRELLLILGTLPVSVASAERNFSTLRRLYIIIYYYNFNNILFHSNTIVLLF